MPIRLRKFIGAVALLALVMVWALVAMALAQSALTDINGFVATLYYIVAGLGWVLPAMPMLSALSAAHLAAILFPPTLRRLYVARDDDPAGDAAYGTLNHRARKSGIDVIPLSPRLADFNDDLRLLGIDTLRAAVRVQLDPQDVARFMLAEDAVR